jgi:hypothetical protein
MEFKLNIESLSVMYPIVNLNLPQTHESIVGSIEAFVEIFGIVKLNQAIRNMMHVYGLMSTLFETNDMEHKNLVTKNIMNLIFVAWRIDPEDWTFNNAWQCFFKQKKMPNSLSLSLWKVEMGIDLSVERKQLFHNIYDHYVTNFDNMVVSLIHY